MSDNLAFVDTETTGLDPDRHEIWEVALITNEVREVWQLPVDLGRADSNALKISRYYERHSRANTVTEMGRFAEYFARHTAGRHLVGAVISFDEERLRKLMRANGACPDWHYHLVDVENLAAGKLGLAPPWDSEELSRAVGVEPSVFERHTALGDAKWAQAIYEAVMA